VTTPARVAVLPKESGPIRIEEILLPDPGPHQVVVKQSASGICHTQLHQLQAPRPAPSLLGHESTGVVLAAGSEVRHVAEGDRIVVTWLPRTPASASRPPGPTLLPLGDGTLAIALDVFTWADHTLVDEQYVVKVPASTPPDVSAVVGCAVMTGAGAVLHTADVRRGESVAVFGVGGVGLCAVAAARVAGADPIIAVDLDDAKLELARLFGATEGVDASEGDAVVAIHQLTRRRDAVTLLRQPVSGVDYAFDCVGLEATGKQALDAVHAGALGAAPGGMAVLVAATSLDAKLNPVEMLLTEKRLVGSLGGSCQPERDFPTFLGWHRDGTLDLDALVTERYTLERINEATDALAAGRIRGRAILEF
jgi:Zn-dependent alcohol dehydrogenase